MPGLSLLRLRTFMITLILMVMMPAMGLMLYTAWQQHKTARDLAQQQLVGLVRTIAGEQDQLITGTHQLLARIAQKRVVQGPVSAAQCRQYLADVLTLYPGYTNLGVADLRGNVYCSGLPAPQRINIRDRRYFKHSLALRGFGIGEYQVGRITGSPTINFAYPLFGPHRAMHGVVFAALSLGWLQNLVANTRMPAGNNVDIIDASGHVLVQYPHRHHGSGERLVAAPFYTYMLTHPGQGSMVLSGGTHQPVFYAYSPLISQKDSLYVVISAPEHQLSAHVDQQFMHNIVILMLLSMAISGIAWVFSRNLFMCRIRKLIDATGKLRDGRLAIRSGLAHTNDELGYLAQSFDSMADSIQAQQQQLVQTDEELKRTNRALLTLSACNRALIHAKCTGELLQQMCMLIVKTGGYTMAWIGVADNEANDGVEILAHAGLSQQQVTRLRSSLAVLPDGDHPLHSVLRNCERRILRDIQQSLPHPADKFVALKQQSAIMLPFDYEGRTGILAIYAGENHAFDDTEVELLEEMTGDLGYGIQSLDNREKQMESEARIRHLAFYDPLTDLPNRYCLEDKLSELISDQCESVAMLMINMEHFGEINNTIGYHHADELLKRFGPRLSQVFAEHTFISRTGGGAFAVLLPHYRHPAALSAANEIQTICTEPFSVSGLDLDVNVTIGISLFPVHGQDAITLIRRASLAMHAAKYATNNIFTYDPSLDQDGPRRLTLATELRRAIESGELQLYLQPKVDINKNCVASAEALCRWFHPEYGEISPTEFITLAEHTSLITPLTLYILAKTISLLDEWNKLGTCLPVAVNLSARNLSHPELVPYIQRQCNERQLPLLLLELEVTESDLMQDPVAAKKTLTQLHNLGISLYIDDFGTGYSSLSYIKQLPMSTIKIDKSFVLDLLTNPDAATIVKSTIAMAHGLSMKVVAEGVETRELYDRLADLGCDQAQGYYIAKPLPAGEFLPWLAQSGWEVADTFAESGLNPVRKDPPRQNSSG